MGKDVKFILLIFYRQQIPTGKILKLLVFLLNRYNLILKYSINLFILLLIPNVIIYYVIKEAKRKNTSIFTILKLN